ncbi:hypothetical protein CARUB_v10027474mg [Capsella rubella]|uniref:Uncharacterized protein n=1 Tax=Capsella rubella TaxID=81985 RepID=R0GPM4_9BRAS|nr:hypothetical protein CARUB_v10027474mg [Capsella rubella]
MAQKGSFSDYTPSSIKYAYANSSNCCEVVTLLLKYLGGAKHNRLFLIKVHSHRAESKCLVPIGVKMSRSSRAGSA